MSFLLSSLFCLAQIAGVSAVAVLSRRSLHASVMQPDVVAGTLAQVERNWRNEVVAFLECNASQPASQGRCAGPKQSFMRSCSSIMGAVVKASAGERSEVKEYMNDVCGQSVLEGFWKNSCLSFASSLDQGMTDDSYTNRVDLNLSLPCMNLFQAFSVNEAKRITKEAEERAAMEKRLAEERAAAARKADEERAEAERKRAEAERKAAEERADAERKAAEEAKKRLEEEARKRVEEAKKKSAEAARQAEEAKRKAAETAAQLKKKEQQAQNKTHEAKSNKPASASNKKAPEHGSEKSPDVVKATAPALVKATMPAKTPVYNATAAGNAASKKDIVAGKAVSKTSNGKSSKK